jgi:hypothetical protein
MSCKAEHQGKDVSAVGTAANVEERVTHRLADGDDDGRSRDDRSSERVLELGRRGVLEILPGLAVLKNEERQATVVRTLASERLCAIRYI